MRSTVCASSARTSSHSDTRLGDRVGRVGRDLDLADGRQRVLLGRRRARAAVTRWRASASGRGGSRARSCRRGWPRRSGRSASARAAGSRFRARAARSTLGQQRVLLDVDLDEGADLVQALLGSRADAAGSRPAPASASRSVMPSRSRRSRIACTSSEPSIARLPKVGVSKRPPSSSANDTTASGRREAPALRQQVHGDQPGDHAERAVEAATLAHAVEVAAGDDRPGGRRRAHAQRLPLRSTLGSQSEPRRGPVEPVGRRPPPPPSTSTVSSSRRRRGRSR